MYCKNCGKQIADGAAFCVNCGFAVGTGKNHCPTCGAPVQSGAAACVQCGTMVNPPQAAPAKSKLAAGLLGIFLGGFGVHNFYLGYTGKAIAQILLNFLCGIGAIWGFIEGILILVGNINTDANGVPLGE
ncbi:MAG: TM2 domain-containing protein [Clostridia bacterium]|nr:TM2 domain-containing protein [Clostridia bacterium]